MGQGARAAVTPARALGTIGPSAAPPPPRPDPLSPTLESNLAALRARLGRACRDAGRDPDGVRLVAVTKGVPVETALALVPLGVADLGESRVDELERKAAAARARGLAVRWHLVGHLQRNKARRALAVADVIHSVDSLGLLETLGRLAAGAGRPVDILLEVRLADEAEKRGLEPPDLLAAARRAVGLPGLRLVGLMTLAPRPQAGAADPHRRAAPVFAELARLARLLEADGEVAPRLPGGRLALSMGMSGDLEHALAAGADLVRIGSALFGGLSSTLGPPARGAGPDPAPHDAGRSATG